jgi:hypothetical protein
MIRIHGQDARATWPIAFVCTTDRWRPEGRRAGQGTHDPVRSAGTGFVSHVHPASRGPAASSHPASPRIGFVLPKSCACTIHHNSLPIKDLPLTWPRCKLGLFGAITLLRGGIAKAFGLDDGLPGRSMANWVCLYHRPRRGSEAPELREGPRLASAKPRPRSSRRIGFVLPKCLACTIHHTSLSVKDLPLTWPRCQLGLFCTFASVTGGSVKALGLGDGLPGLSGANWVCLYNTLLPSHKS